MTRFNSFWTKWPPFRWSWRHFKIHFFKWKNTKFHGSLFRVVQLAIFQHRIRYWLGADQATSHYLNQCWPNSTTHICSTREKWVKHHWQSSCTDISPSSNGNIFRVTGPFCGEFAGHKGRWRGALMIPLICAWTNGRVNNRDAGDLRRHRAHRDVNIMW